MARFLAWSSAKHIGPGRRSNVMFSLHQLVRDAGSRSDHARLLLLSNFSCPVTLIWFYFFNNCRIGVKLLTKLFRTHSSDFRCSTAKNELNVHSWFQCNHEVLWFKKSYRKLWRQERFHFRLFAFFWMSRERFQSQSYLPIIDSSVFLTIWKTVKSSKTNFKLVILFLTSISSILGCNWS